MNAALCGVGKWASAVRTYALFILGFALVVVNVVANLIGWPIMCIVLGISVGYVLPFVISGDPVPVLWVKVCLPVISLIAIAGIYELYKISARRHDMGVSKYIAEQLARNSIYAQQAATSYNERIAQNNLREALDCWEAYSTEVLIEANKQKIKQLDPVKFFLLVLYLVSNKEKLTCRVVDSIDESEEGGS